MRPVFTRTAIRIARALGFFTLFASQAIASDRLPVGIFATVDGTSITAEEFTAEFRERARKKFYHGRAPETELTAYRREVGEQLVLRVVLLREAERSGVQPDEATVGQRLAAVEKRYGSEPRWPQYKDRILVQAGKRFQEDSRIEKLESLIREVPAPTDEQLRAYHGANPLKFTTPEQIAVSMILLRVPPSAPPEVWEQSRTRIQDLHSRLQAGAEFGEMARQHSDDASAAAGGNLGFLHRDMLGGAAQDAVDRMTVGSLSGPVQLLEGFALFRLDGRRPAVLNGLDTVRDRAASLWLREARDNKWKEFGAQLRRSAAVIVDERFFAAQGDGAAGQHALPLTGQAK